MKWSFGLVKRDKLVRIAERRSFKENALKFLAIKKGTTDWLKFPESIYLSTFHKSVPVENDEAINETENEKTAEMPA
ncbi:hypothetical protein F7984_05275 [Pradoshia sp. D12]|uniref:hypothetical protein n=1 Tax=Bacillaceae TaxID=186817 RepID=UPI0011282AA9|nr:MULTISPECIES: hypothetical protein [Bacillaceae]QFK70692.1 hypothetical protein F7984_05275 [Pradoshia sp. D12]TPF72487.1 hypothetical protein FHY44_01670 [Bacillus sp. D12]